MYQFFYIKISSTNHDANLVLLDDPSRVRSQITSGLCPKTLVLCAGFVHRVYLKIPEVVTKENAGKEEKPGGCANDALASAQNSAAGPALQPDTGVCQEVT
jgi:hypothetical protein